MKKEYVFALTTLLWCVIVSSVHAEQQGSSESKPLDNLSVSPSESSVQNTTKPAENDGPAFTLPSGPMASDLIDVVRSPPKPDDEKDPLVIKLPGGAIVSPSGELIGAQNATNSTSVTTNNEPATFPSVVFFFPTAIGALTALVWWRKRKNRRHKESIRRHSSLYEERVR